MARHLSSAPRIVAFTFIALLGACSDGDRSSGTISTIADDPGQPAMLTLTPQNTGDDWPISSPAAEDIDADALLAALESIRDGAYTKVDSMVIVRHGRLVAEGYFNGYGRESLHDLRSSGKSFTSALTGIAIEQRLIELEQPIAQFIPQFENHRNMDDRKRAITVFHLLNMNSGLACDDWNPASPGNEEGMYPSQDWVGFILDLPMAAEPGTAASYCTGGVVVLGHLLSQQSGMALDDYAAAYLFGPLHIGQSKWRRSPDGQATGGGGLWLTPRDAAKLGVLYLEGGRWNGQQVVPQAWVQLSQQRIDTLGDDGYGFLWWKRTFDRADGAVDSFYTSGNGGNFVFVMPALDLVVVFTGSNYNSDLMNQPFHILSDRILPAVR